LALAKAILGEALRRGLALRVGVLGGAFNPPHVGHLVCAQEACWQLGLDRVLLMPVGEEPHRRIEHDAGRERRYELCRLAVSGSDTIEASRLEVDREGASYTVQTLRTLRERSPDDELFLLLGGDAAKELRGWREPEEIFALARVTVAERAGAPREQVEAAVTGIRGSDSLEFFSMPSIGVSSTLVRERVAAGRPIHYLVPDAVVDYIEVEGLYRQGATVGGDGT
jgi:nicotinate-nucleotide adenylyltransferase